MPASFLHDLENLCKCKLLALVNCGTDLRRSLGDYLLLLPSFRRSCMNIQGNEEGSYWKWRPSFHSNFARKWKKLSNL